METDYSQLTSKSEEKNGAKTEKTRLISKGRELGERGKQLKKAIGNRLFRKIEGN
jgi:hypothetical protein